MKPVIGTLLFVAAGVAGLILLVWLAQYGPGRALVRVLYWIANEAAGYHTHKTLFRLTPPRLADQERFRKMPRTAMQRRSYWPSEPE